MKTLYIINTQDDLIEGVFDGNGVLLGAWSPNDANWRNEYFAPFMERLGFTIVTQDEELEDTLRHEAMRLWNLTEEEVGLD